jgi:hypothetical protein
MYEKALFFYMLSYCKRSFKKSCAVDYKINIIHCVKLT